MSAMSDTLYEEAKEAIRRVADDSSVDLEVVLDNLYGLRDELEIFIESVETDVEAKERRDDQADPE